MTRMVAERTLLSSLQKQPVAESLLCEGSLLQMKSRHWAKSPENNSEVLDPTIPEADTTFTLSVYKKQKFPHRGLRHSEPSLLTLAAKKVLTDKRNRFTTSQPQNLLRRGLHFSDAVGCLLLWLLHFALFLGLEK